MSKEPSMEEILSSIKRIIAEEGEEAVRSSSRGTRRAASVAPVPVRQGFRDVDDDFGLDDIHSDDDVDEVLELTDEIELEERMPAPAPIPEPVAEKPAPAKARAAKAEPAPAPAPTPAAPAPAATAPATPETPTRESILSVESEVAARHSLSALSSMVVRPSESGGGDNTLDALVRSMLRPMLKEWLDANLPELVEAMVAKEIARITSRGT